jgi:Leucine-rich repeat (LRR) protein
MIAFDATNLKSALSAPLKVISLRLDNYKVLPSEIIKFENLEFLYLGSFEEKANFGWNDLSTLPDDFILLKKLRNLNLSDNNFEDIPELLSKMKSIEILDLSRNPLKKLTTLNVKTLILDGCTEFDPILFPHMPNLEDLSLMSCNLVEKKFPKDFADRVPNLRTLNIAANHLKKIPNEIEELHLDSLETFSNDFN